MLSLFVALSCGQTLMPGPVVSFPASGGPVGVPMTEGASVQVFDGGYLVAWSDSRRLHLLPAPPRAFEVVDDVWVKWVGARPEPARIMCPSSRPVSTPRLAVSRTTGTAALVWSDGLDGMASAPASTHLAQFDTSGALDARGECGTLLSMATSAEVSAKGSSFVVVLSRPASLGLVRVEVAGQVVLASQVVSLGTTSNVVTVEGATRTFIGWVRPDGRLALELDGVSTARAGQPMNAFDLVGGTDEAVVGSVTDAGFVNPNAGVLPGNFTDRPFGARFDGGVVFAYAFDAGTRLWSSGTSLSLVRREVQGRPEGLAIRSNDGLALVSHPPGVLGSIGLVAESGFTSFAATTATPVSTAAVLQRRPSLAWDPAERGWVVVWEEANSATTWTSRLAVMRSDGGVQPSAELFIDGGWPRVLGLLDGGLVYYALENQTTNVFLPVPAGNGRLQWFDSLDASVRLAVPGASSGLAWTSQNVTDHTELVTRGSLPPLAATIAGQVTCAAWVDGEFIVTRLGVAGAVSVARFRDDAVPSAGQSRTGTRSCVATEPFAVPPRVGFVTAYDTANRLEVETLGGRNWTVGVDAGVRDLQMTAIDGRWLAVWDTQAGLFAGLFAENEPPQLTQLDTLPPTHRGFPVVASSTEHAAAVAWPVLVNDSVVIRLRTIPVPDGGAEPDAGVDAGSLRDAGTLEDAGVVPDGGVVDGVVDGGAPDAGAVVFVPVCGCESGPSGGLNSLLALAMLSLLVSRLRG